MIKKCKIRIFFSLSNLGQKLDAEGGVSADIANN